MSEEIDKKKKKKEEKRKLIIEKKERAEEVRKLVVELYNLATTTKTIAKVLVANGFPATENSVSALISRLRASGVELPYRRERENVKNVNKPYTEEEGRKILEMRERGCEISEIAHELGRSYGAIAMKIMKMAEKNHEPV